MLFLHVKISPEKDRYAHLLCSVTNESLADRSRDLPALLLLDIHLASYVCTVMEKEI